MRQSLSGVFMHTQQLQAGALHDKRLKQGRGHFDQLHGLPGGVQVIAGSSVCASLRIKPLQLCAALAALRTATLAASALVDTSTSGVAASAGGVAVLSAAQYEVHCMAKFMAELPQAQRNLLVRAIQHTTRLQTQGNSSPCVASPSSFSSPSGSGSSTAPLHLLPRPRGLLT